MALSRSATLTRRISSYSLDRRPVYVEQGARQQGVAIFEPTSPEEAEQKIQAIFGEIGVAGKDCDEDLVTL
jgi:hypothetical protein